MNSLRTRLKSRAGETLAEVLIALLIAALGVTMFAIMISAALNTITTNRTQLETYYMDTSLASPNGGKATVSIGLSGTSETYSYTVDTYSCKLGKDSVTAYLYPTPSAAP